MNRYVSSFLFFLCLTAGCLVALFFITGSMEAQKVQVTESVEQQAFAGSAAVNESETAGREPVYHIVLNQEKVVPSVASENYCLVSEEGYLIVYDRDMDAVNMFTHMPLRDFPVEEQEKLMEGIWFETMTEIFSYLESYTS